VTIGENGVFFDLESDILNDVHAFLGDGLRHNIDVVIDPTITSTVNTGRSSIPLPPMRSTRAWAMSSNTMVRRSGSKTSLRHRLCDADTYTGVPVAGQAAEKSSAMPSAPLPALPEKGWMEQIYVGQPAEGRPTVRPAMCAAPSTPTTDPRTARRS